MSRHSLTFLVAFVITATPVAAFIYDGRPLYGLVAGVAGLLVHWALSRDGDRDGELADSSYFFGFLLTLVVLAVGVYRIGAPLSDAAGPGAAPGDAGVRTIDVLGFLTDLATGLVLTIAGLVIRRARTLAGATRDVLDERSLIAAQHDLTESLKAVTELWRERPEQQVLEELHASRQIARDAAENLDRSLAAAGSRMIASVGRLDQATTSATQSMTRAASGVGESLASMAERLEAEIAGVVSVVRTSVTESTARMQEEVARALAAIEQQRIASDDALVQAREAGRKALDEATSHHQEQLELWRATREQTRDALDRAHRGLDEQYRRGMKQYVAAGDAFAQLAEQTTSHVQALPNPADRLAGLWDGVRQRETDLTEAVAGAVMELGALRERSEALRVSIEQLGGSTDRAAGMIGAGGDRLAGSLRTELDQMNAVIEEYVTLLERTTKQLKVRA
jgi:hypothetical protein